ncbi:MAG: hypothetical protein PHY16_17190 [Methylobacter sp.]|nr:hypothetical protein [Methylobacter sp.]
MTIKEFAYSAQQHLEAQSGEKFKRTHIYELLAASFGYNSFAALCAESVVFQGKQASKNSSQHNLDLRQRCAELGYTSATADIVFAELPPLIAEQRLSIVNIPELISKLRGEFSYQNGYPESDADDYDDEIEDNAFFTQSDAEDHYYQDDLSAELLAGLELAAEKGNSQAHYAIALFLMPNPDSDQTPGSEYWYTQEQQGRVLIGVEKEWADEYVQSINNAQKFEFHLREAGRLGNEDALLDLAEHFDDPSFFEQSSNGENHDPLRVAEIAESLGRIHDIHEWLTKAAEAGDTEAMRRLIEEFDQDDLQRCWSWIYLAQLLDTDLMRDDYYAIHEDGSDYDDDVGGNMYMDGRDGIKLPPLSGDQDALVRQTAKALFEKMQ